MPVRLAQPLRTWKDSTGRFEVDAQLVDFADGNVRLRKPNGELLLIAAERLSAADQEYVRGVAK